MPAKILLLEDDILLSEILTDELRENGFEVCLCEDAKSALESGYEQHFDLWIFDVKVPLGKDFTKKNQKSTLANGFEVLRELRALGKTTPAIFLTSLAMLDDVKEGFLAGCDDYVRKPFEIDELLLRIHSLLKRRFAHQQIQTLNLGGGFYFDIIQKTLFSNGVIISLTNKERELLALLLENRGKFVTQDMIFERIWNYDEMPTNMALRVYIKNLRKILGKEAIITQRFRGYCYAQKL